MLGSDGGAQAVPRAGREPTRREAGGVGPHWLPSNSELAHRQADWLLTQPGCPACREEQESQRLYYVWLFGESHTEPETLAQLQASRGWCPRHTRRLLVETTVPSVPAYVFSHVVRDVLRQLGETAFTGGLCPTCEAVRRARTAVGESLLDRLAQPAGERAYLDHGGVCVVHACSLLTACGSPIAARVVVEALAARVDTPSSDASARRVLGETDSDAGLRHRLLRALPVEDRGEAAAPSSLEALTMVLELQSCPVCLRAGRMERRALEWIIVEFDRGSPRIAQEMTELCLAHLDDLALLRADVGAQVLPVIVGHWSARVASARKGLDALSRRSRGRRREPVREAIAPLIRAGHCPVCHSIAVTNDRQLRLLRTAARDLTFQAHYERNHGCCVHHLATLGATAPALIGEVTAARLEALLWELEEAARKRAWDTRHEAPGPEQTAWLRTPPLLDGRALAGAPAAVATAALSSR